MAGQAVQMVAQMEAPETVRLGKAVNFLVAQERGGLIAFGRGKSVFCIFNRLLYPVLEDGTVARQCNGFPAPQRFDNVFPIEGSLGVELKWQ